MRKPSERTLAKLAAVAEEIRKNPLPLLVQDANENYIGEMFERKDGLWQARPYGPEYKKGWVVVGTGEEAEEYVRERGV